MALEYERRTADIVQRAIAALPAPKDGAPGRDGWSPDDISLSVHGRTLVVDFKNGTHAVSRETQIEGLVLDAGVYKPATHYVKGDGVTYGGSLWIAQRDTELSPGGSNGDWRLAVKRGRDAKGA